MPPKKGAAKPTAAPAAVAAISAPPPVAVPKDFSINVKVIMNEKPVDTKRNIRARFISEWLDCCLTTEVFGNEALPWFPVVPPTTDTGENLDDLFPKYSIFEWGQDLNTLDLPMIEKFNKSPHVYVVMMSQSEGEATAMQPLSFTMVDCSAFSLQAGDFKCRTETIHGMYMEVTVTSRKALMEPSMVIPYEPFIINLQSLTGYPIREGESPIDAFRDSYIYGSVDFGEFSRTIFMRPLIESNHQSGKSKVALSFSSVILPGLVDLVKFKEMLSSSTTLLELHREEIRKRAFHNRNIDEYNKILQNSPRGDGKHGKGKAPPAAAPAKGAKKPEGAPTPEPATDGDRFLIEIIGRALRTSAEINPHGSLRLRLEQLLSSSNDLLAEFERAKHQRLDDRVIVREDMLIEARLQKPSKPVKWSMPKDLSLKDALQQMRLDQQSQLDGTLAPHREDLQLTAGSTSGLGGTGTSGRKKTEHPRHEMFFDCGTCLKMFAEIHRKISHPRVPPGVWNDVDGNLLTTKLPPMPPPDVLYGESSSPSKGKTGNKTPEGKGKASGTGSASAGKRTGSRGGSRGGRRPRADAGVEEELDDEKRALFIARADLYRRLAETPFARMVLAFRYSDDATLGKLNAAIAKVNEDALPDIQGSLRSYSFSKAEEKAANDGELDVITGFSIIDDDYRIVVLEGLAGPGQGMQSLFMDLPRSKADDAEFKMLCNPEVLFPKRLYAEFGPDIKRIRVREKLKKLARRPELYNRKQVEESTFISIDKLMTLRRATDMLTTKQLDMYPPADSLNMLELLYGEAISRADLDGSEAEAQREAAKKLRASQNIMAEDEDEAAPVEEPVLDFDNGDENDGERIPISRNIKYEKTLRARATVEPKDFLAEQRELKRLAWESMLLRKNEQDEFLQRTLDSTFGKDAPNQKVYMYASQKLNFKALAFDEMRRSLKKTKDTTFTYSANFLSQTVVVATVDDVDSAASKKSEWLTPSGFLYPKPRTRKELITHPKRPPEARITELQTEWEEQIHRPRVEANPDPELQKLEIGYSSTFKKQETFGALEPMEFERPFELRLVGDKQKLPRGVIVRGEEKDRDFFKSVHLGGAEALRLVQEAQEKEKADWKSKVVVATEDFKVGGFSVRDRPIQMDRAGDILDGEVKHHALKHLRSLKSTTGKDFGYQTAPVSIITVCPYAAKPKETPKEILTRVSDETKFITAKDPLGPSFTVSGRPKDFQHYINRESAAPQLYRAVARRKHLPLDGREERAGPKWDTPGN